MLGGSRELTVQHPKILKLLGEQLFCSSKDILLRRSRKIFSE